MLICPDSQCWPSSYIFQQPEMLRRLVMGPPTSSWRLETGTSRWHHPPQGAWGWSPSPSSRWAAVCSCLRGQAPHAHRVLLTLPGSDATAGTLRPAALRRQASPPSKHRCAHMGSCHSSVVTLSFGISQNAPQWWLGSDPQHSSCIPYPKAATVLHPAARSEALFKNVWMHLLPTRRHPPKKGLGSKGVAGLSAFSRQKKKEKEKVGEGQRAKPGVPSPPSLPCSWKTMQGVKTQSIKVCTAPFLEIAPLGSCYSSAVLKKAVLHLAAGGATAGFEHSWPDVADPGADMPVHMLQSWVLAGRSQCRGSRVPVPVGRAACSPVVLLLPRPSQHGCRGFGSGWWERDHPEVLHCLRVAVWYPQRF